MFKLPLNSTLIKKEIRSSDVRGEIISLIDADIYNVSLITCKADSIRSNHYHKLDYHFMYILEGKIDYFFKDLNGSQIKYFEVNVGDTIFTPPLEIHATYFPINTKMIVCSKNPRDQETYESDTIRVDFINEDNLKQMLRDHG